MPLGAFFITLVNMNELPRYCQLKSDVKVTEKEVIKILLSSKDSESFCDIRPFLNGVYGIVPATTFFDYEGVYVSTNILREDLKLEKGRKPGDIDVLIIPYSKTKVWFEYAVAYEVKIVRPKRNNPQRNANSLGVTQLKGLISDGFPAIGLLHVCITEPLLVEEMMDINYCTLKANSGIGPAIGKTFDDYIFPTKFDHFSWWSSDKQIRRLMALDIPTFAVIECVGLDFWEDGSISCSFSSFEFKDFLKGALNPYINNLTVLKIKLHFHKNFRLYKKMHFKRF